MQSWKLQNWFLSRSSLMAKDNGSRKVGCTYLPSGLWLPPWPFSRFSGHHVARKLSCQLRTFLMEIQTAFHEHLRATWSSSRLRKTGIRTRLWPTFVSPRELSTGIEYMGRLKKVNAICKMYICKSIMYTAAYLGNFIRFVRLSFYRASFFNLINVFIRITLVKDKGCALQREYSI